MFQIDWGQSESWSGVENRDGGQEAHTSRLSREAVRRTSLLYWEDHCLECAAPLCYTTCSLYVARADKRCSRFLYGIYPNPRFQGLLDYGADVQFRRWGKLEALVYGKSASVSAHRVLDRLNRSITPMFGARKGRPTRVLTRGLSVLWKITLSRVRDVILRNKYFFIGTPEADNASYNEFVLECFLPGEKASRLILEYSVGSITSDHTFVGQVTCRHSFTIVPGWSFHTVSAEQFNPHHQRGVGKIALYPENNAEARFVFTWLDFVEYRRKPATAVLKTQPGFPGPAAKVKCVAWDLDNTLWKGILAEDSEAGLTPRPQVLQLIKELDAKGIVQTVVSKNNFTDAWAVIERLGLQEYFLHPRINWQPKSSNLKEIAATLNINVDSFVLIDDSPFERAEVQSALPQVRVYDEDAVSTLLRLPEFDVPVTESSKKRRTSYLTEIQREKAKEGFGSDYEAFLRSCKMSVRLFVPRDEKHVSRCLELIQRANQLNLSNARYTADEFTALLSRPGVLAVAMHCKDRFGDYGIVGLAVVDEGQEVPNLRDLVLSCRVAQKKVEQTFVQWLACREFASGRATLRATIVRTDRNQPIVRVFDELNFKPADAENGSSYMALPLSGNISIDDVISLDPDDDLRVSQNEKPRLVSLER